MSSSSRARTWPSGEDEETAPATSARDAAIDLGLVVVLDVALLLEGAEPLRAEVAELALPEVPLVLREVPPHPAPVDALEVHVEAQVAAVHGHVGEVAPGDGEAGLLEDAVGEALLEPGRVLDGVVQGEPLQAVEGLSLDEAVEAHLEGRALLVQGAEEALLPDRHPVPPHAVHGDGRREPVEGLREGLHEAGLAVGGGDVPPAAGLPPEDVPVAGAPSRSPPRRRGRARRGPPPGRSGRRGRRVPRSRRRPGPRPWRRSRRAGTAVVGDGVSSSRALALDAA